MKLELPHKDILNVLYLNQFQLKELKQYIKGSNKRKEPSDDSIGEILDEIVDPAYYGIEGYEVCDILENVTHVSIENHTWKDKSGNVETCKKVVVKSDSCSYEGTHLEFLIKNDFNDPHIVMRVVSKTETVEVGLWYQNLSPRIHDPETNYKNVGVIFE